MSDSENYYIYRRWLVCLGPVRLGPLNRSEHGFICASRRVPGMFLRGARRVR